ncbi:PIN2/TERF1-interacting telomerase inhibitor 1-like [Clytia hemisphaerica]|uniref:G-patch domain-containing protein n=1 Tax=Clytia hemisphaerica TaxID=252671 RepID=A0A7M5XF56_9CNID
MSMLAEPRSRQKWSEDPRNTRWSSDKSKFGYQMLTKMGWSEGLGLGSTLQGHTSHVKIKKKKNGHGIGMKTSHDDDWIAHQDSFNALLSSLNTGDAPSDKKIQSLEDRVRVTRTKIMYSRFVKSKDLSRASNNDLACIFGQRSKSAPSTPQRSEDEDGSLSDGSTASCPTQKRAKDAKAGKSTTEHGFTTISSGVSVADYFASKMAALKQGSKTSLASTTDRVPDQENTDSKDTEETESVPKKKKKHKNVTFDITEISSTDESEQIKQEEEEECTETKKSKKKKHKKSQKSSDIVEEETSQEENVDVKKKKKKKKARLEEGTDEQQYVVCREKKEKSKDRVEESTTNQNSDEQSSSNSESPQPSKSKKSKKKKNSRNVEEVENESKNIVDDETMTSSSSSSKKSKKKKRRHEESEEVSHENDGGEERKKKRKKRHQSDGEDGAN